MRLTYDEFTARIFQTKREALHMNMRDSYGTQIEQPHIAKWRAGEPDALGWLESWCQVMRESIAAGKAFRRVDLASEPLSEYHRWLLDTQHPIVEAGQDIRWVSRRLVSELLFPGNDFWLIDDELVIFLHYTGDGLNADIVTTTDPLVIRRCRDSFETVWPLGVPSGQYRPSA